MRILHTSDWHLGKRLADFDRIEEQVEVLEEICRIANEHQADVVLVAGDLFDTFNPPTMAIELFYKSLKRLSINGRRPVIAIAGNHDSPDRIEAPDPLARECGIIFAGYPHSEVVPFQLETGIQVIQSNPGFLEVKLPQYVYPLRLLLTPYANELRLRTFLGDENEEEELRSLLQRNWLNLCNLHCDEQSVNVLVAHLFVTKLGSIPPNEPDDEKSILNVGGAQAIFSSDIPEQIQYTALGHLHRMQCIDAEKSPVYYSGSPLSYSFAEANQEKYVLMVDATPGNAAKVQEIKLKAGKRLLRCRFESVEEAIQWLRDNPHSFVELTMVSDTYLTAQIQKQLHDAHDGIVAIIPEIIGATSAEITQQKSIDFSQNMEELFVAYFAYQKKQAPDDEILAMFREMLAQEGD